MDEMPGMIRPDLQALFPAYAGVILSVTRCRAASATFPRLCGGDPHETLGNRSMLHFSPPVRG